jgi:hypothetical protein
MQDAFENKLISAAQNNINNADRFYLITAEYTIYTTRSKG